MTYAWALLIAAVVLAVLFAFGVFNQANFFDNVCISFSGFYCSTPSLTGNGVLATTFGQNIGVPITLTGIGCSNTASPPILILGQNLSMPAGAKVAMNFTCPISSGNIGTLFTGTLWITYTLGSQQALESEIGEVQVLVDMHGMPTGVPAQPITQSAYADISLSRTATFKFPVSAGDMVVAAFAATFMGSCSPPTITDTLGSSWTVETSECNQGAAGNKYQYASISYAIAGFNGIDSVTASTTSDHGVLVIYDLSPAPNIMASAPPGSGTTGMIAYKTGTLSFPAGSALINGLAESSGGGCCVPGTGFDSYGVSSGWGSEFSNSIASPTSFPILGSAGEGTNGWAEVGAAFGR
jgi:hypothetical protein